MLQKAAAQPQASQATAVVVMTMIDGNESGVDGVLWLFLLLAALLTEPLSFLVF